MPPNNWTWTFYDTRFLVVLCLLFLFYRTFLYFLGVLLPHKWQLWSILGSALILFFTYYQVQVAVAVNNWYRPFYDAIQNALSGSSTTTASDLYGYILEFFDTRDDLCVDFDYDEFFC